MASIAPTGTGRPVTAVAQPTPNDRLGFFGYLWLRLRRQHKGFILLEAVAAVAFIAIVANGLTTGTLSSVRAQNANNNFAVATQGTDAQIEAIKAMSWAKVGTTPTARQGDRLISGTPVRTGVIPGVQTVTVRGLELTITTGVAWANPPRGGSAYGMKAIVMETSWQNGPEGARKSIIRTVTLTPGISEAAPSKVRGS